MDKGNRSRALSLLSLWRPDILANDPVPCFQSSTSKVDVPSLIPSEPRHRGCNWSRPYLGSRSENAARDIEQIYDPQKGAFSLAGQMHISFAFGHFSRLGS